MGFGQRTKFRSTLERRGREHSGTWNGKGRQVHDSDVCGRLRGPGAPRGARGWAPGAGPSLPARACVPTDSPATFAQKRAGRNRRQCPEPPRRTSPRLRRVPLRPGSQPPPAAQTAHRAPRDAAPGALPTAVPMLLLQPEPSAQSQADGTRRDVWCSAARPLEGL